MRRTDHARAGVALLEVLVALVILGSAGLAMISLALHAGQAVRRAEVSEAEMRRASDFLMHVSLWERIDLDRHLGDHRQGEWRLEVTRPTEALYHLALRDSTGAHLVLAATLYRPAPDAGVAP